MTKPKPPGYWTKKTIKKEIKDFKTFKQWIQESKRSYVAATRLKLLSDKDLTGHLIKVEGMP